MLKEDIYLRQFIQYPALFLCFFLIRVDRKQGTQIRDGISLQIERNVSHTRHVVLLMWKIPSTKQLPVCK